MARIWLRAGLIVLTLLEGVIGVWAAAFPWSFYRDFPTPGRAWLQLLPPFNEHLVRDYGLAVLQFTAVLVLAAVVLERRLVTAVLLGFLVFHIGHVAYHFAHLVGPDVGVQLAGLLGPPVLGLVLLMINLRLPQERGAAPSAAATQ